MIRTHGLFIVLVLFVVGCATSPAAPSLPATFTLAPGETAVARGVTVTFVGVLSDSRCPIDANCISAGEAISVFTVSIAGRRDELELTIVDQGGRRGTVRGVTVEMDALLPSPLSTTVIEPEDYRATFTLTR